MRRIVLLALLAALVSMASVHAAPAHTGKATKMEALVYKAFGTGWEGRCMVRVMYRESNGNPKAINWKDRHANGPGSFGLFQIGRIHVGMVGGDWRRLLDPATNVRVAKRLFDGSGIRPWRSC